VLKLKTAEFKIVTRGHTPSSPPSPREKLTIIALSLRERVFLGPQQPFRLVGVGLSNSPGLDSSNDSKLSPYIMTLNSHVSPYRVSILEAQKWAFSNRTMNSKNPLNESYVRTLHTKMFDQVWK
jgi:hypothetical protein